jgi:hypothetical protein
VLPVELAPNFAFVAARIDEMLLAARCAFLPSLRIHGTHFCSLFYQKARRC